MAGALPDRAGRGLVWAGAGAAVALAGVVAYNNLRAQPIAPAGRLPPPPTMVARATEPAHAAALTETAAPGAAVGEPAATAAVDPIPATMIVERSFIGPPAEAPPAGAPTAAEPAPVKRVPNPLARAASGPQPGKAGRKPVASSTTLINVNTASAAELELLPGVGPVLAAKIVEHRDRHGSFAGPEDLEKVRGIGPKLLEKIAPHVTFVRPPVKKSGTR
ncbi:MAG TPA: helix-hairpin-helix domain-containing protein [Phycisphaerales bacterium]|nr:helix-hairpin-helix domain-containing protein [Phycisphaerales bacterium]